MVSDPFLLDSRKRKRAGGRTQGRAREEERVAEDSVTDVLLDEEGAAGSVSPPPADLDEEFAGELAADKRRRLAKQYLENVREEIEGADAQDLDNDIIARRLQLDVAEQRGVVYKRVGDTLDLTPEATKTRLSRVGSKGVTALAVAYPYAYTVSKDMELVKWDLRGKPKRTKHTRGGAQHRELHSDVSLNGHCDEILCVAVSDDGRYVATGGRDNRIVVWSTELLAPVRCVETRKGGPHTKGDVLGLLFRRGSHQLYAACADLRVRTYNSVELMAALETLYGHQDAVCGISALAQERCVTVGARDRSAMLWKISEELRLTFRSGDSERVVKDLEPGFSEGLLDCVAMVDELHFVTGSDNGSLALWLLAKKKPLCVVRCAHGVVPRKPSASYLAETDAGVRDAQQPPELPFPVTAVAALPYSDVFVLGLRDGVVRVWQILENLRLFEPVGELEGANGYVTGLAVVESKKREVVVVGGVGKEPRLGRWEKGAGGRNGLFTGKVCVKQTR